VWQVVHQAYKKRHPERVRTAARKLPGENWERQEVERWQVGGAG